MDRMFDQSTGQQKHWTDVDEDGTYWVCDCGFKTQSSDDANAHDQLGFMDEPPEAPGLVELEATLEAIVAKAQEEGLRQGRLEAAHLARGVAGAGDLGIEATMALRKLADDIERGRL